MEPGCGRDFFKACNQSFAYSSGTKVAGTSHLKHHIDKGTCPALLQHTHDNNDNENGVEARALNERSVGLNASCSKDLLSLERVVKILGWLLSCQEEIMNFTGRTLVKRSRLKSAKRGTAIVASSYEELWIETFAQKRVRCRQLYRRIKTSSLPADRDRSFTGGSRRELHRRVYEDRNDKLYEDLWFFGGYIQSKALSLVEESFEL
ncbi:hypothetical protein F2Q70_00017099 [Brassica cretica]|uniref:Uncharacterized protein n=1 Tax=Brassica cretica TaxID=69181 RepID=A0A8S9HPX7_BRACR|nr:hypothetical protein F2Q70_00017099 [Brassica cretica]KAF2595694.1 hypothetical protein F2Q68_00010050 [Brassica cretica]